MADSWLRLPARRGSQPGPFVWLLSFALIMTLGTLPRPAASDAERSTPAASAERQGSDYYDWLGSGARTSKSPAAGPRGEPNLRWQSKAKWTLEETAVSQGVVVVAGHGEEHFTAIALATGRELWQHPKGGGYNQHLFAGPDGFYRLAEGRIVAIAAATGAMRWRYAPTVGTVREISADTAGGPLVVITVPSGVDLVWLDRVTGAERRRVSLPPEVTTAAPADHPGAELAGNAGVAPVRDHDDGARERPEFRTSFNTRIRHLCVRSRRRRQRHRRGKREVAVAYRNRSFDLLSPCDHGSCRCRHRARNRSRG